MLVVQFSLYIVIVLFVLYRYALQRNMVLISSYNRQRGTQCELASYNKRLNVFREAYIGVVAKVVPIPGN